MMNTELYTIEFAIYTHGGISWFNKSIVTERVSERYSDWIGPNEPYWIDVSKRNVLWMIL